MKARGTIMDPITAGRAAAILDGSKRSIKSIASVPVDDILAFRDDLVPANGSGDDRELLSELKELERRRYELCQRRIEVRGRSNKKEYITASDEAQHVGKRLKEGTRELCRRLKDADSVALNLESIETEANEVAALLAATSRDLHHRCAFDNLTEAVRSMVASREQKESLIEKDRQLSESVARLRSLIQSEQEQFERETLRLHEETNALTEELLAIRNGTCQKTLAHRAETAARKNAILRECRQDEDDLREQIRRLRQTVEKEGRAHEGVVAFLSQKRDELASEMSTRKESFEDCLQRKEMEYAKLVDDRDESLGILIDFQRRWDKDEARKKEVEEEKEREKQRKLNEEQQAEREHFAAILIQKRAKSYLKRKAKAKSAKGKKKGGKKGKGKGKKK